MDTYDVAIAGAGIAGSAAATLLARRGARVALIERHADPNAYKTVCTTFIQASATPAIRRLGLAPRIEAAGAVRNGMNIWTRWGWISPVLDDGYPHPTHGYSIRRQTLDPLVRALAAETSGVDLLMGHTVKALRFNSGRVTGLVAHGRDGAAREIQASLVVGADGRGSKVGELAGVPAKTKPHGRLGYFAHYRGLSGASKMWMLEPETAFELAQDDGVTVLAYMPTKDRLPEFKADPEGSLERALAALPDGPALADAQRVSKVIGKVDMTNTWRPAARNGIAFLGDAAAAFDPLWGVGCGFAFQSAEWLADCVADALGSPRSLDRALARYRRRYRARLAGHYFMSCDYATGRDLNPIERLMFSAAARDGAAAAHVHAFGTRSIGPARFLAPPALARAAWVSARTRRAAARLAPATP